MGVTAEVRWFWTDVAVEQDLENWFNILWDGILPIGIGATPRVDAYLVDLNQPRLSIKRRSVNNSKSNNPAEFKGLVDPHFDSIESGIFAGTVELWSKWSASLDLSPHSAVTVEKQRYMRRFRVDEEGGAIEYGLTDYERQTGELRPPTEGCNIEFTRVKIPMLDCKAVTFAFESFGSITKVAGSLKATVRVVESRTPPVVPAGMEASYPVWLNRILSDNKVTM
ncbi:MAG TPA: hypothetical protein V6C72_03900 [Chroococcales cyanobacterium]